MENKYEELNKGLLFNSFGRLTPFLLELSACEIVSIVLLVDYPLKVIKFFLNLVCLKALFSIYVLALLSIERMQEESFSRSFYFFGLERAEILYNLISSIFFYFSAIFCFNSQLL